MTGFLTGSPAIVDDTAKYLEQPGCAMNLVNDDELSPLSAQEGIGIVKPPAIGRSLEVEVDRFRSACLRDATRQRCLSHLPRTQQNDAGASVQSCAD